MRPVSDGAVPDRAGATARFLQAEATPERALQHVVEVAVDLVPACEAAAAVLPGDVGADLWAAGDDTAARAVALQGEVGEGPWAPPPPDRGLVVDDLRTDAPWPVWGRRVHDELDLTSAASVPIHPAEGSGGTLVMLSRRVAAFEETDLREGLGVAALASVAVRAAARIASVDASEVGDTAIAQAVGILMVRHDLVDAQALDVLRRMARDSGRRVVDVARELVDAAGSP